MFRGQLSSWLIPAAEALNVSSMAPRELLALSGLFPQLGTSFLLSLPSQQLLEILSQPGSHSYSPAQVSRDILLIFHVASCHVLVLVRSNVLYRVFEEMQECSNRHTSENINKDILLIQPECHSIQFTTMKVTHK